VSQVAFLGALVVAAVESVLMDTRVVANDVLVGSGVLRRSRAVGALRRNRTNAMSENRKNAIFLTAYNIAHRFVAVESPKRDIGQSQKCDFPQRI
jgi:hypothetical protein